MKAARDHLPSLRKRLRPRVVYADLDGTLLGRGGSLFAGRDGAITLRPAEAIAALHRAGAALVPVSGRTRSQTREVARLVGSEDFICELGGITCYRLGEEIVRAYPDADESPFAAMARSGAPALLLEAFDGRLEPHAPWSFEGRECSMLLRGNVDVAEARRILRQGGYDRFDFHDNGIIVRTMEGLDEVHVYHLLPAGVTKASAVAADMARRGLRSEEAIAVGDAPSDAEIGAWVGAVFIVANGRRSVEAGGVADADLYLTDGERGDGFAEAILGLLES